ncbi:hypothetical protein C8Q77DRAFT_1152781 [Trametes polyzona]|nr:hypothetical protein C8Q77DRAFT_1152781 [Trametes polyzona]
MSSTVAAPRTATAQSVSRILCSATAEGGEGLQGCCPIGRMFELVEAGLRLLFIGAASVVLALAGILLSIVAAVRRAYERWRGIEPASHIEPDQEPLSSPLRDRDHHGHRPQLRHKSTSSSRKARDASISRTPLRSSPEPMLPHEQRDSSSSPPAKRRHRRRLNHLSTDLPGLPSIDAAMESVEASSQPLGRPPLDVRSGVTDRDPARALSSPAQVNSDSSPTHSTEPSIASESTEDKARAERSPSPSRRVLQRLREHHSQLRERCLTRVHSMPNPKPAKPTRRTDPYQAPYYFPTPLSPDADTYVEQVRSERRGTAPADPISFRQYWDPIPLPSPRTSPKSKEEPLPPSTPEIVVSPATEAAPPSPKDEVLARPSLRERSHRWSWHLPHLHGKAHHDEAEQREETQEKPHSPAKFLFGHHRRRNVTAPHFYP